MKWTHSLLLPAAALAVSLSGCSTQAKKVDCDGTLRPINRPAPATAPAKESQAKESKAKP